MFDKELHEHYMKKILEGIFTNNIGKYLAFKGGTLTYFKYNLDRFSTDIDLDILDNKQEETLINAMREILLNIGDIKNETLGESLHRWIFRYNETGMNIKVELNKRIRKNNNYEIIDIFGTKITCMEKSSIFTNKMVALYERLYNRDLFDVNFFFKQNFILDQNLIFERFGADKSDFIKELIITLESDFNNKNILSGLGEVLTNKQKARAKEFLLEEVIIYLHKEIGIEQTKQLKKIHITKSLFVEFCKEPKLARWHVNNKIVYDVVNEENHGSMDGIEVGQAAEDAVLQLYKNQGKQSTTVDMEHIDYDNRHQSYHQLTQQLFQSNKLPDLIEQGAFAVDDVFTKCDLLVLNDNGKYDLVEVKSKNDIRKKTKAQPLLDDLMNDLSFQAHILRQTLGALFSGNCFLAYLNKDYVKHGTINYRDLIIIEEVSNEILSANIIENTLGHIRKNISLPQEAFDQIYIYKGGDYMMYFGIPKPKDSIRSIPRIGKKVVDFYPQKTALKDFNNEDVLKLYNAKGEPTNKSKFVELRAQGQTVIDTHAIQERFDKELSFPLYFYDYETITRPIPLLDKTSPRQQVVVQYSLHKIEADGTITHTESILQPGEKSNERIIQELIKDFEGGNGTYIVRYKGFENTRNKELAKAYPQHKDILQKVNDNTFDLMEIFRDLQYFDRRFQGSASIKKVLPVLTDISYDQMEVKNGAIAADLLRQIAQTDHVNEQMQTNITNLLTYCKQDTRAMVRIWQEVTKKL